MDPLDIPDYLIAKNVRQLIMVSGFDLNNNPVHKSIYSAFVGVRKANYKLLPADFEANSRNEKQSMRSSNGYLKRDWPLKYLNNRPSLIILFVDLNWDHPEWLQKRMECESKIASLRQSLNCRETRVILVLIQNKSFSMDDSQVKERATELSSSLQLTEKQLFVFPQNEKHENVASRLDGLFYEFSQTFYQNILRKIRSRSISNNYSNLLIRQQFKLGFIAEVRHDTHSALRFYKQAYQNCLDAEVHDPEMYEYLSVISLLNYKICELSFQHNIVQEAVNQFRKIMLLFSKRPAGSYPSPQLSQIEFLKWKSKQCKTFAILFVEAINNGLVAFSHENPGFYFEKAGDFLRQANELIVAMKAGREPEQLKSINKDILAFPEVTAETTIYYGQRPWRVKSALMSSLDPLIEHAARLALENTCNPDYKTIIHLLSLSIRQYQLYSCGRMLTQIRLKIAEECFYLREFTSASNSIQLVISKLHKERATLLLQVALLKALDIAFCRVDVNDYLWILSQLLNPSILNPTHAIKANINSLSTFLVENYVSILNSSSPKPSTMLNKYFVPSELSSICEQWNQLLSKTCEVNLSFANIEGHLNIFGAFLTGEKHQMFSGETIFIQVSITNTIPVNLIFSKCRVYVDEHGLSRSMSNSNHSLTLSRENITVPANSTVNLVFSTQLHLSLPARQESSFYIKQILLDFTSTNGQLNGLFKFDKPESSHQRKFDSLAFENNVETSSIRVLPIVPKIELRHITNSNILMDEVAVLKFSLTNQESFAFQKITVTARQLDTDDEQPAGYEFPSLMFESAGAWQPRQTYDIVSELATGSEVIFNIPCKARCQFKSLLQIQVNASVSNSNSSWFGDLIDHSFNFPMSGTLPFKLETRLLADNSDPIRFLLQGHRSILECDLIPMFSGELHDLKFELSPEFVAENLENESANQYEAITVGQLIKKRLRFRTITNKPKFDTISLGQALISWKRSVNREVAQTALPLNIYPFKYVPLLVEPNVFNNSLVMRNPNKIEYLIKNLTKEIIEIRVAVDRVDNEHLVFESFAERKIILLPEHEYNLIITAVALKAGTISLPRLKIKCEDKQIDEQIQSTTLRYVRSNVFVVPSSKSGTPQRSLDDDRRSSSVSRGSSVI